jgi:hypothetical protein
MIRGTVQERSAHTSRACESASSIADFYVRLLSIVIVRLCASKLRPRWPSLGEYTEHSLPRTGGISWLSQVFGLPLLLLAVLAAILHCP